MPDDTQNFELKRPDAGATDWNEPLNWNFQKLDEELVVTTMEDDLADQHYPYDDQIAIAYDTGRVFVGRDGQRWEPMFSLSGDGTDTATSDSTSGGSGGLSSEVVVSAVEDVQPAIDDLADAGGGTVVVEPGTYQVDADVGPFALRDGVSVRGAGMGRTVFELQEAIDGTVFQDPGDEDITDVTIRDFRVNGNGYPDAGAVRVGAGTNPARVVVKRVYAADCPQTGISLRRGAECTFRECVADTCGGVSLNMALCENSKVLDSYVLNPQGKGDPDYEHVSDSADGGFSHSISVEQSVGNTVSGCIVDGNPDTKGLGINTMSHEDGAIVGNVVRNVEHGIDLVRYARRCVVSGNTVRGCASRGINVQSWDEDVPTDNLVTGNVVSSCGEAGIRLWYAGRTVVRGNHVQGCQTGVWAYEPNHPQVVAGNTLRANDRAMDIDDFKRGGDAAYPVVRDNEARGDVSVAMTGSTVRGNTVRGTLSVDAPGTTVAFNVADALETPDDARREYNVTG